jgi:LuxR family maltose regulon positive regulatory protein
VLYERNDLDAAARHLTRGIEVAQAGSNWIPVLRGYLGLALLDQARGQVEAAAEQLARAEEIAPKAIRAREARQISSWKARLSLAQGELGAAAAWADAQGPELALRTIPAYSQEFQYLTLVRIRIAQRDADLIPGLLDGMRQAAEAQGRMGRAIEILALQALALATLGRTDEATVALGGALGLAEPEGYVRTFADFGAPMGDLLRRAAVRGIRLDYVNELLDVLEGECAGGPGPSPSAAVSTVEPLTERELEVLRLLTTHLSSTEMAQQLVISVNTVRSHVKNIYGKLSVHSRADAVQKAKDLRLV